MNDAKQTPIGPLEELTGDLFVNRQAELTLFIDDWVGHIPQHPNNSQALVGRRCTGKTSLLVKLFNHLFHQQRRVIPVYISFARFLNRTNPLTMQEVAEHYLASYLLAFWPFVINAPIC